MDWLFLKLKSQKISFNLFTSSNAFIFKYPSTIARFLSTRYRTQSVNTDSDKFGHLYIYPVEIGELLNLCFLSKNSENTNAIKSFVW